jgi:isopentenyl-diphosphate Delta-isomerase
MNPPEEIFDIVDSNDRVIGLAPRSEIHAKGLLHRAVHLWIFHPDGRLLLQKRSLTKDREPGRWTSSVSGHVNSQEDYDTAMHREIPEEIGVPASTCKDFQKVKQFPASLETDKEFVWLYQAVHPGPFQPDPHEVASLDWFFPAQINQMLRDQPSTFSSCLRLLWNQRPR